MIHLPDRLNDEVHGLGGRLLDLLFPARCVSCNKIGSALCDACFTSIHRVTPPFCLHCGHPLRTPQSVCLACRDHPSCLSSMHAAAWHEGVVRQAIHALKYNRRRDVAVPLARLLAAQCAQIPATIDWITSVPLYPARERERGYNQAELLAKQTARLVRSPYVRALRRTRATADQIGLNADERRDNVREAFALDKVESTGKNLVLIDDVCTTGATLDACAAALFAGGARAVYGLTVTRAH